mmetsp:Transcript_34552/g.75638  ORF Transcript_34552/g.75638 Transcript_34552/m.75638 type:complete len:224 (-) Transcript_34552:76-747(-)
MASIGGDEGEATLSNSERGHRRCQYPGCEKAVKSRGLCQGHGGQSKPCKIENCEKQAQGGRMGMCFRHWKATTTSNSPHELALSHLAEPAEEHYNSARANLPSVYDNVIPSSITWKIDRASSPMSLVSFLTSNFKLGRGWHRNQEWAARGDLMVGSLSMHLQAWEKQLVMLETALLAGIRNAPYRELAHAWGKHLGFHSDLVTTICKRKGDLDRLRSPRRNCN